MKKQQIDKNQLMEQLEKYRENLRTHPYSDEEFYETKIFISSILDNKWIRDKKELAQQLKLARNSCKIRKHKSLANHIILAQGYLRNKD